MARAIGTAGLVAALTFAFASPSAAQTPAEPDAAFQDATGLVWGVATFEATVLGAILLTTADTCESWGCGVLVGVAAAVGLGLAIGVGVATGAADTPADVPFVFHHSLVGLSVGLATGAGIAGLARDEPNTEGSAFAVGLGAGAATGLSLGLYTGLRRDALVRDPDVVAPAHVMTWVPMLAMGLTTLIAGALTDDGYLPALVAGLVGLATYGATIAWAESSR